MHIFQPLGEVDVTLGGVDVTFRVSNVKGGQI